MMKTVKRFLSMMLVLSLMLSLVVMPTMAVSVEEVTPSVQQKPSAGKTESAEVEKENGSAENQLIFSDKVIFNNKTLKVDLTGTPTKGNEVQIDYNDPVISVVYRELQTMKVLNDEGQSVALTPEQIGTVMYLYQQYLNHWTANANVLGVQVPFFLTYNDNGEDGLGILGEMLALANVPVEDVRTGAYKYDDLVGMIQNFTYGDALGVAYYGAAIAAARDEVLALVKNSGAQTEAQKLLVINDWLAHVNTFDMPYIMNNGKADGEKPMVAPNPVKFDRYDDVYAVIFNDYKPQIAQQFHDPIYAEVVASFRQNFYEAAIREAVIQGGMQEALAQAAQDPQLLAAAEQVYWQQVYEQALKAQQDEIYQNAYDIAYREYLYENCGHNVLNVAEADVQWVTEGETTANAVCSQCGLTFENQTAVVSKDASSTAPTCEVDGKDVFVANVTVVGDDGAALGSVKVRKSVTLPAAGHNYVEGTCSVCGAAEGTQAEISGDEVQEVAPTVNVDDRLVRAAQANAELQAEFAVEDAQADMEAAAKAAADAAVAEMTDEQKAEIAIEILKQDEATMADIRAQVEPAADQFMTDNADAIAADALGFIKAAFGEEAAAQFEAQCDAFIASAETDGVEVQPGVVMTIEQIVQNTMANEAVINLGTEEAPYMVTPNQAIEIYADQAATGLTNGVINYWEGSHFGALGFGTSVCLGYAKAYTYLVQCLYPEVYGKNGADSDLTKSEEWKTREELYHNENGELDIEAGYVVDLVRVTFDASVTMYGQTQDNFNSDHFWNAVKLDGKWYYVDPCYTDVFTEVMMRDRVETDGSMNHLYFLFSHTSCAKLYDGYYKEIKTLYEAAAVHTDYEDSWISRVKSNVYSDGEYFYYLYDSTDLLTIMEETNNSTSNTEIDDPIYKIVRHKISNNDFGDGDKDYETLVVFNYKENDDADPIATVYVPSEMATVDSELLTKLYIRHAAYAQKYPSLALGMALYEGKVYFNLANCLLTYNPVDGTVELVKEYNTVHGKRDTTKAFGGMAFSVVDSAEEADFTITDHPIAGMTIKADGKLYVSIATNFAFISGKDPFNSADQTSFGYEFEESNYNTAYNQYNDYGGYDDDQLAQYGYTRETNDNDEFMWTANFVEILDMAHVVGGTHTFEAVTIAPVCGVDGYTENRCTDCGVSEAGTRVVAEGTALEHHFIKFTEKYYTKDDAGRWNSGECYICPSCLYSVTEPVKPVENDSYGQFGTSYEEQLAEYEEKKAIYDAAVASSGHHYVPTDAVWAEDGTSVVFSNLTCDNVCSQRQQLLDCTREDTTISVVLSQSYTVEAQVVDYEGNCATGLKAVYAASSKVEGYPFTVSTAIDLEAGKHAYEASFLWTANEDGTFSAVANLSCPVCGDAHEQLPAVVTKDTANSVATSCAAAGKDVYLASVVVTDAEGNEIGSASSTMEIVIEKLPHTFVDGVCSECGAVQMTAPVVKSCYSKLQTSVKVTWTTQDNVDGYQLWRTTTPDDDSSWTCTKTVNDGTTDRYTNQGLTPGVTYYYKVRAFINNADGSKTYSDFSNVHYMPAAVVFDGPYSNATYRIRLRWNEIGGSHGYQIWRLDDEGNWKIIKTLGDKGNELTNNQGATTAYSNTGLTAGETYTYRMRAFMITEDGRKVFGAYSDEYTVAVKPETPVVTVTSPKASRAQITWDSVYGATGYQIWMADSADGEYKIVKSVTDPSVTSYTKYDLESGKTYYFKVRAYVEVEGRKAFSAYSDIQSIQVK